MGATAKISDYEVCVAYLVYRQSLDIQATSGIRFYPDEYLAKKFSVPEKVAFSAMARTCGRGYIEYGVSLRTGWLTDKGKELIVKGGV